MTRSRSILASLVLLAGLAACGQSSSSAAVADPVPEGGTAAPDGARGFCCPAKTGGCALTGGYREKGTCPQNFDICDNMCEQRIVKDEHGCDVLTYKLPPVTTTYAGTGSCSGAVYNGGRGVDGGPDGGDGGDAGDGGDDADSGG